ncbi:MAG: hypothetical protein ACKVLN_09405 [Rhodobacterales bacterium]|jgi:hypothetical protein
MNTTLGAIDLLCAGPAERARMALDAQAALARLALDQVSRPTDLLAWLRRELKYDDAGDPLTATWAELSFFAALLVDLKNPLLQSIFLSQGAETESYLADLNRADPNRMATQAATRHNFITALQRTTATRPKTCSPAPRRRTIQADTPSNRITEPPHQSSLNNEKRYS